MIMKNLQESIRQLGYQLSVRELYGENTPEYFQLKRTHDRLLARLYKKEKRN